MIISQFNQNKTNYVWQFIKYNSNNTEGKSKDHDGWYPIRRRAAKLYQSFHLELIK